VLSCCAAADPSNINPPTARTASDLLIVFMRE
jgi:hypothetical protein